ncbi:MAG: hypothetical protein ACXWD3_18360, partial [Mycobacterium sp.]
DHRLHPPQWVIRPHPPVEIYLIAEKLLLPLVLSHHIRRLPQLVCPRFNYADDLGNTPSTLDWSEHPHR